MKAIFNFLRWISPKFDAMIREAQKTRKAQAAAMQIMLDEVRKRRNEGQGVWRINTALYPSLYEYKRGNYSEIINPAK